MRKILSALLIWIALSSLVVFILNKLFFSETYEDLKPKNEFVQLQDGKFVLNGKPFFPIALNFVVSLSTNDTSLWPAVYVGYLPDSLRFSNKEDCLKELRATLQLIKDVGFNTVRITHIGEPQIRNFKTGLVSFPSSNGNNHDYPVYLENDQAYTKYLDAIEELLKAVNDAGLKAIFTVRMFHEVPATENHLIRLCKRFNNQPALMAYDFFNEPLYFDSLKHEKADVYKHTLYWNHYCPIKVENFKIWKIPESVDLIIS